MSLKLHPHEDLGFQGLHQPASRGAGTTNSAAIDRLASGYQYKAAAAVLMVGAGGGSVTIKLQESRDNSTWTDVSGYTRTLSTSGIKVMPIAIGSLERYLRIALIHAGGATLSAVHFLGIQPERGPVS